MRTVAVPLYDLLDLVNAAELYGYGRSIFYSTMMDWCGGTVSDEDIEAFARSFLTQEKRQLGFTEDDYDLTKQRLTEWRNTYKAKDA